MIRDLLWGGLCFAAGYAVGKQLPSIKQDLEHYDRLRAMSGEEPIIQELGSRAAGFASMGLQLLRNQRLDGPLGAILSLIPGLRQDIARYGSLKAM